MKRIYLDNAATTPVMREVLRAMEPYFSENYGNASSLHKEGIDAREAIERARKTVANVIKASPNEIIFTSGGSESDNLAIKGVAFAHGSGHIITAQIEHPAVLNTCKYLEKKGFSVTYLPVSEDGFVDPIDVKKAIKQDTILVTIMHANNEIGTIQPIEEIGRICKEKNILFHTDAVQSFGKIEIDVNKVNINLLSASAHKINGPKGVGCLFIRNSKLEPLVHGGPQEFDKRAGTENVTGIVGFAKACEITRINDKKIERLRDKLINELLKIKGCSLNGAKKNRLPNNVNVSFKNIEGEALLLKLDAVGIAASTGSACSTRSLKPSHVLIALGLTPEEAHGSLRLTIGRYTTEKEVTYAIKEIKKAVDYLRRLSPYKKL